MEKIKNFILPEHTNGIYMQEAISSVSLTIEIAEKINELIDAYNTLSNDDTEWKLNQESNIRKAIVYMKDNLVNSLYDLVQLYLKDDKFADLISNVLGSEYNQIREFVKNLNYVTPQMFGAVGDGVVDDTKAIQKALTFAETHKSHTVKFPIGTYRVAGNGVIFESKFVSLVGDNSTILVSNGDGKTDLFMFTGTSDNYNGVIKGLRFDYEKKDFTMINNVFNFVFNKEDDILYGLEISNCWFGKNKGYKIYTEGFTNGGFNNCRFNNNIVYGLFIKSLSYGDSNKIKGNSLYGSEEIQLNNYVINLTQTSGSSGCEVSENNCTSGLGIFNNFHNLMIHNNQIENTEQLNIDYLIKIVNGGCVTIDTNNLNAHYNCGLIYSNVVNCFIRNCNWYGLKKGCFALNNDKAHITFVEGVRYFDSANIFFNLTGDIVNGYATNTVYDNESYKMYIDSALNLHIKPKVTGTFPIAPLSINIDNGECFIPVEYVDNEVKCIKITNRNYLRTEKLLTTYANLPLSYF